MVASDAAWKLVSNYPSTDRKRQIYLTVKQRRAILKECSTALRDFLTIMAMCGARSGEIARAKVADYSRKDKTLRLVDYKNRKGEPRVRYIGLTDDAAVLVERHARLRIPTLPLFVNEFDREWNTKHWTLKFREAVQAARDAGVSIPNNTVPTCLRHSTITDWVNAGMTPGDVARTVGTSIVKIESNDYKGRETTSICAGIQVI
jgi:integrase